MNPNIEKKRAYRRAYMKRYREEKNPDRKEEGRRYWQKYKQEILARRKLKPITEKERIYGRIYAKRWREKNPQKFAETQKKYNRKNPGRSWALVQRRQEKKAGRPRPENCEICNTADTGPGRKGNGRIAFDHCHQTGAFRGWICGHCNKALGFAKNDPTLLRKLAAYLEQTSNKCE